MGDGPPWAVEVVVPGIGIRRLDDPRDPRPALGFEGGERLGLRRPRQPVRQPPGILDRHAGALREEGQGRMRGVADQHRLAVLPARGDRLAEEPPVAAALDRREPAGHRPAEAGEGRPQRRRVALLRPVGSGPVRRLEHRHDVSQALAQRIADEVASRPHEDLRYRRRVRRGGDQRPPCGLPGEERRVGVAEPPALDRMQPVGADHQRRLGPAGDRLAEPQLDPLGPRRGLEQRHQPGAVDAAERLVGAVAAEVQPGHRPAGLVAELDRLLADRDGGEGFAQAQRVEHPARIRRDLDAGPDLAELAGTLVHRHPRPPLREGERRRQPADAAADDGDGAVLQRGMRDHRHGVTSAARAAAPAARTPPRPVQSSRWTRSRRSCRSCASSVMVAIGRASRRLRLIGSPVISQ